jgi:FkbM family methyltransferase
MEINKLKSEISTEPWPDGLYPLSVRMKDDKGRYLTGAVVSISPRPATGLIYETREAVPEGGVELDKRISQLNLLVPPGKYKVTYLKGGVETSLEATVVDPVDVITSKTWKDDKPFYYRDQRWDRYIIKENSYGAVVLTDNDYVIDVGAHIGVFTRSALAAGAKVIAYEPENHNYGLLLRNAEEYKDRFESRRAAVVADDSDFAAQGYASLWIDADGDGDSGRSALHSLYRTRGARLPLNVPVVRWSEVASNQEATILKVDVEGAELTYDWAIVGKMSKLHTVTLEIENKGKFKDEKQAIIDSLRSCNFSLVKETNGWATVQLWRR